VSYQLKAEDLGDSKDKVMMFSITTNAGRFRAHENAAADNSRT